jgi:hypothetical protein
MDMKDVPGYLDWQADEDGNVYKRYKMVTPFIDNGYYKVWANSENTKKAKLVCLAFHGEKPFDKAEVCHKDDMRINDKASNLKWGTRIENMNDALINGRRPFGIKHGMSKLCDDTVLEMRTMYASGDWTYKEIAYVFGCSYTATYNAINFITWKHVA